MVRKEIYLVNNDGTNAVGNYKRANDIDPKLSVAKTKIGELYLNAKSGINRNSGFRKYVFPNKFSGQFG